MNTNFKKLKRGLSLFLFYSLFFPCLALSNFQFNKKIEENKELLIPLKLKDNSFIKGSYKANSYVQRIELLDENKNFLKRLDTPQRLESNFYFLSDKRKNFYVKIFNDKKQNNLEFKIEKVLVANYKKDKDKEEIISPFLNKQKDEILKTNDTTFFWKEIKKKGTPLIEHIKEDDYIITFLFKGAKHNVRLLGGPIADHVLLTKLGNSDIWFKSFKVKKGIRMSYQLAPDVPNIEGTKREKRVAILSTAQCDPFNKTPYKFTKDSYLDKYGTSSTFEIVEDDYVDWTHNQNNPKGKILDTKIKSKILENERKISIYIPNNFDSSKPHNLLFVFDGTSYQLKVPTPTILDNLIFEKKIFPTIAVFVDNPSRKARSEELPANKKFADFMAKELLPFVKEKVSFKHEAKNTILTGSSYGGLASMYVAFSYPKLFGNVLSQSGSFWWGEARDGEDQWLTRQIAKSEKKDLNIYLNAGLYETGYSSIDILESNRHLRTVLKAKNYENVIYKEFPNSHDYFAWKSNLARGLISLRELKK